MPNVRDAKPFLSKPHFGAVEFTIAPGANEVTVNLQNTTSFFAQK